MSSQPDTFYKSFSEKKLTTYGSGRRGKIERHRLALLHRFARGPGTMFEIGPGHGSLAEQAVAAGWDYTAVEASPILIDVLRNGVSHLSWNFLNSYPSRIPERAGIL